MSAAGVFALDLRYTANRVGASLDVEMASAEEAETRRRKR
jgi:hypothetical protein